MKSNDEKKGKWDKIRLENLIFYYGALEKSEIYARRGALYCTQGGTMLKGLLHVYNHFFSGQNRRRLRREWRWWRSVYSSYAQQYYADVQRSVIGKSFHLPAILPKRKENRCSERYREDASKNFRTS